MGAGSDIASIDRKLSVTPLGHRSQMDVRRVQIGWVQVKITRETKKGPRIDVDSSQFAFLFLETLKAIFYMTPKRSGVAHLAVIRICI